jgi:hypothetical protein
MGRKKFGENFLQGGFAMRVSFFVAFGLAFAGCKARNYETSQTNAINLKRIAKIAALPQMSGCFRVALVKVRSLTTSVPKSFFEQANCDFMAESTAAADRIKKDWTTANESNSLSGCLLAFQPLNSDISFSYSLIMRTEENGVTNASWRENSLSSNETRQQSDGENGILVITPERNNFTGPAVFESLGQGTGRAYLSANGTADARSAEIVVEFKNNVSSVLKYYGHVVENIPCKGP